MADEQRSVTRRPKARKAVSPGAMSSFHHSLPMILYRTLDAVMPEFRELFARHNLTEQQWRVLRVLWEEQRASSAELSARTLLPAPSLVGIIDRLEKKGLVVRVRSTTDRRVVHVTATAEGRELGSEVAPYVEHLNDRIRSSVTPREWEALESTLVTIAAAMTADGDEPSTSSDDQRPTADTATSA